MRMISDEKSNRFIASTYSRSKRNGINKDLFDQKGIPVPSENGKKTY
jgi:hypothetical protein